MAYFPHNNAKILSQICWSKKEYTYFKALGSHMAICGKE